MVRGTTAQFQFKMPYNYSEVSMVKITFWQEGNDGPSESRPLPIIKTLTQCKPCDDSKKVAITLTEEETLRFSDESKAFVQLRGRSKDGSTFASKQEVVTVYPVYDDNILDDGILPTPAQDGWVILDGEIVL